MDDPPGGGLSASFRTSPGARIARAAGDVAAAGVVDELCTFVPPGSVTVPFCSVSVSEPMSLVVVTSPGLPEASVWLVTSLSP